MAFHVPDFILERRTDKLLSQLDSLFAYIARQSFCHIVILKWRRLSVSGNWLPMSYVKKPACRRQILPVTHGRAFSSKPTPEPIQHWKALLPLGSAAPAKIYSGSCAVPASASFIVVDVSALTSTASLVQSVVSGRSSAFSIPARKSRLVSSVAMAR